jgi:hypothetical protein
LHELVEGRDKYGPTRSPWRLLADKDPGCWAAVRPKARSAAARQLAAEPHCQTPGHGRQPADRCVLCMSEKIAPVTEERPELDPEARAEADAKAARYLASVQQKRSGSVAKAS